MSAYAVKSWCEAMRLELERQADMEEEKKPPKKNLGIDWKDPEAVRQYKREHSRAQRERKLREEFPFLYEEERKECAN